MYYRIIPIKDFLNMWVKVKDDFQSVQHTLESLFNFFVLFHDRHQILQL